MRVKTKDVNQILTFIRCNAIDPDILDKDYSDLNSSCADCLYGPSSPESWHNCARKGCSLAHNVLRWVVDGDVDKIKHLYSRTGCFREESFQLDLAMARSEYEYVKTLILKKYSEGEFYGM